MEVIYAVAAVAAFVALAFIFVALARVMGSILAGILALILGLIRVAYYLTPIVSGVVIGLYIWTSSKAAGNLVVAVGLVGGLWWIKHLMKDDCCDCPLHRFDARLKGCVNKLEKWDW